MRLWLSGLFLLGALTALVLVPFPAFSLEDGIVAVVDNDVITAKDVQDYLRGIYAQLRIEGRTDGEIREIMSEYESKGVEQLVDDRLILAEANRQGMMIRPKAIDDRVEEIKKRYASSQEFLAEINKEGVTISDIRRKIEDQFKAQYVVSKDVRDRIYVNPQEVTDYYNSHLQEYRRQPRVYLQSIFVRADAPGDPERRIGDALTKIRAGEDFKAVAQAYSDLPDIGEVPEKSLGVDFEEKVRLMQVGEVSGVIRRAEGSYILKLTGRIPAAQASLNEVKETIYQRLFEVKFREGFKSWIEKLRKKAYVEIKK